MRRRRTWSSTTASSARSARCAAWLGALAVAGACDLREVTIAEPDDIIVAEIVLVANAPVQRGVLHRTRGTGEPPGEVHGAVVTIRGEDGRALQMLESSSPSFCFVDSSDDDELPPGTCYGSIGGPFVVAGRRYELEIDLPDGRRLTGETTVPDGFRLEAPRDAFCILRPGTTLEVTWTGAEGAWVYAVETEMRGLAAALALSGVELESEPLRLFGLSVSRSDTTIVFPTEFGLFDRFDPDLTDALAAIQDGLPAGVEADIVVAAADRNYVNWERGGNFNPSGFVRVPSVFGDGTGVFASILTRGFSLGTTALPGLPEC